MWGSPNRMARCGKSSNDEERVEGAPATIYESLAPSTADECCQNAASLENCWPMLVSYMPLGCGFLLACKESAAARGESRLEKSILVTVQTRRTNRMVSQFSQLSGLKLRESG